MSDDTTHAALERNIDQHRVEHSAVLLAMWRLPSVSAQQRAIAERQGPRSTTVLPCETIANSAVGYPARGAHTPNEHIRLSDFAAGSKLTARVFLRTRELAGADESRRAR